MIYIVYAVTIIILLGWGFRLFAFFISSLWYTRQKRKVEIAEKKSVSDPILHNKTNFNNKKSRGLSKVMPFINGVNKVSNRNVSLIPFHWLRNYIYRHVLKIEMDNNVVIYKGTIFRDGYKCHIGGGTIIGDDNVIDARGGVSIGRDCNFSSDVRIWTAQHDLQDEDFAYESAPVIIGAKCWISSNVTILPGVAIGDGCVIASGAVVTKNCEKYSVYGGVPAKKIGERNQNLRYSFSGTHDLFL